MVAGRLPVRNAGRLLSVRSARSVRDAKEDVRQRLELSAACSRRNLAALSESIGQDARTESRTTYCNARRAPPPVDAETTTLQEKVSKTEVAFPESIQIAKY